MKNRKSFAFIIFLISMFLITSCDFIKTLPKPEHIPFNKTDYNGFYRLGQNGKSFKLHNNDSIIYNVIKDDFIGLDKVKFARVDLASVGDRPMIYIELNKKGSDAFKILTSKNIKKQIAIIFNNTLYLCPTIQSEISYGEVSISSDLTIQETVNIVNYINLNK